MLCQIPSDLLDASGCVKTGDLQSLALSGCEIPQGLCLTVEEPQAPRRAQEHPLMPDVAPALSAPSLTPGGVPVAAAPVQTQAVVAQPAPAPADPTAQLMALAGQKDVSPMAVVAGVAALAGSGVVLKFAKDLFQSRKETAEKKAEQEYELKKMELEQKSKQGEDQHQACGVARAALEARVVAAEQRAGALDARLASTEQSLADLGKRAQAALATIEESSQDAAKVEARLTEKADALSKRITKLETAAKKAAPKGK
jgi:hypothetical protein